jgi:hypothetical protein
MRVSEKYGFVVTENEDKGMEENDKESINRGSVKSEINMREKADKVSRGGSELASEEKIVQKSKGQYKSRYQGELAPKSDIVVDNYSASYKSRYK